MKHVIRFFALLLLAAGIVGFAPGAGAAPDKKEAPPAKTASKSAKAAPKVSFTRDFIRKATIGNGFEIMSSRLALDRSNNPEICDFARRMVEDHDQADDRLRAAVYESGYRMKNMPNDLDKKHRAMLRQLENTPPGENFDRLYVHMQRQGHNEAVDLYRRYARQGGNPVIRDFANDLLPVIEEHREHVKDIRFYR